MPVSSSRSFIHQYNSDGTLAFSAITLEHTLYYDNGPAIIPVSIQWPYPTVTIVGRLSQPYFDTRVTVTRDATNPYDVTFDTVRTYWTQCTESITGQAVLVPNAYNSAYVGQSAPATMIAGTKAQAWVELRNVGNVAWVHTVWFNAGDAPAAAGTKGAVLLGTDGPQDRTSPFYADGSWFSPSRLAAIDDSPAVRFGNPDPSPILPGQIARLSFPLQAPTTPGNYVEHFRPVVEGITWMNDLGIYFPIQVQSAPLTGLNSTVYLPGV